MLSQLLLIEIWDIAAYVMMVFRRQHNVETLSEQAPPPPLLHPVPGGVLLDQHRREWAQEMETRQFPYRTSARFSISRIFTHMGLFSTDASRKKGWKVPLWLTKMHHLVGTAAYGLVADYIAHQPTVLLVWIFISLIFAHFFMWLADTIPKYSHDEEVAVAAIVGWLYLVRRKEGGGGPHFLQFFA